MMSGKEHYKIPDEMVHDGMILKVNMVKDAIPRMEKLNTNPTDVIIATYPRSGTTWVSEMTSLIMENGDINKKQEKSHVERVLYLEYKVEPPPPMEPYYGVEIAERMAGMPRLLKTHLPYKYIQRQVEENGTKAIVVLRNIRDVLVSVFNFYKSNSIDFGNYQGSWDDFFEMFRNQHILYGDWLDHLKSYWPVRHLGNVHVIFYEAAIDDLEGTVIQLTKFLGKELSADSVQNVVKHSRFGEMKQNSQKILIGGNVHLPQGHQVDSIVKNFFREGGYGKWRKYFRQEQDEYVKQNYDAKLQELGITFKY